MGFEFQKSVLFGVTGHSCCISGLLDKCCILSVSYFQQYFMGLELFTRYFNEHSYSLLSYRA